MNNEAKTRAGKFFIAPVSEPTDAYAAGYDGNVFDSESEARATIAELVAVAFPETNGNYWTVSQY